MTSCAALFPMPRSVALAEHSVDSRSVDSRRGAVRTVAHLQQQTALRRTAPARAWQAEVGLELLKSAKRLAVLVETERPNRHSDASHAFGTSHSLKTRQIK